MKTYIDVERLYLETFALNKPLTFWAIWSIFCLIVAVLPVVIISISISPVVGSVAACCIAILTRLMAYYTSDIYTKFDSLIFANA